MHRTQNTSPRVHWGTQMLALMVPLHSWRYIILNHSWLLCITVYTTSTHIRLTIRVEVLIFYLIFIFYIPLSKFKDKAHDVHTHRERERESEWRSKKADVCLQTCRPTGLPKIDSSILYIPLQPNAQWLLATCSNCTSSSLYILPACS